MVFWYHMFGQHQGTLKVFANSSSSKPIFSVAGQQGNLWVKAQATINSTTAMVSLVTNCNGRCLSFAHHHTQTKKSKIMVLNKQNFFSSRALIYW